MRILSRKIWRAFPELDQFDDEICKMYVRRSTSLKNAWRGVLLMLIIIPVAVVLWGMFSWAVRVFNYGLQDQYAWYISDTTEDVFVIMFLTGNVWFPAMCFFLVRDRWLNRCIQKQLSGTSCPPCGYSLVGLSVVEHEDARCVVCPECGTYTKLNTGHITEADINPSLLTKS
jgi:hypothetical protein